LTRSKEGERQPVLRKKVEREIPSTAVEKSSAHSIAMRKRIGRALRSASSEASVRMSEGAESAGGGSRCTSCSSASWLSCAAWIRSSAALFSRTLSSTPARCRSAPLSASTTLRRPTASPQSHSIRSIPPAGRSAGARSSSPAGRASCRRSSSSSPASSLLRSSRSCASSDTRRSAARSTSSRSDSTSSPGPSRAAAPASNALPSASSHDPSASWGGAAAGAGAATDGSKGPHDVSFSRGIRMRHLSGPAQRLSAVLCAGCPAAWRCVGGGFGWGAPREACAVRGGVARERLEDHQ